MVMRCLLIMEMKYMISSIKYAIYDCNFLNKIISHRCIFDIVLTKYKEYRFGKKAKLLKGLRKYHKIIFLSLCKFCMFAFCLRISINVIQVCGRWTRCNWLAQSVEHEAFNIKVVGSILTLSDFFFNRIYY